MHYTDHEDYLSRIGFVTAMSRSEFGDMQEFIIGKDELWGLVREHWEKLENSAVFTGLQQKVIGPEIMFSVKGHFYAGFEVNVHGQFYESFGLIVRNYRNPHDPNAIRVFAVRKEDDTYPEGTYKYKAVGYIAKEQATPLARAVVPGTRVSASSRQRSAASLGTPDAGSGTTLAAAA
jgi:hypothetical protein